MKDARYEVTDEAIRARAYDLSIERPEATAEENWLLAEAQLCAEAEARREADVKAGETAAGLMATIEMSVHGHS